MRLLVHLVAAFAPAFVAVVFALELWRGRHDGNGVDREEQVLAAAGCAWFALAAIVLLFDAV